MDPRHAVIAVLLTAIAAGNVYAQSLYKYRGEDGEWIYTDRKPADDEDAEVRDLRASFTPPAFKLLHRFAGQTVEFVADNDFVAPVEVVLDLSTVIGVSYPQPDEELRWVVGPSSETTVLTLQMFGGDTAPYVEYRYRFLVGDPDAVHAADAVYRVPFAAGASFPVTQAYPDAVTHRTPDSRYAVDIAMPVGTDILAARGGVVIDVASQNFRGGLDSTRRGGEANIVRILHDDGTFSLYAHLNWNSIRVKPGDEVRAGEYIADSGNTGYSTGPHLHFAVQRNAGMRVEALPVAFQGPNAAQIVPRSGEQLVGYR